MLNRLFRRNYHSSTRVFEKIDGRSVYYSKVGHGTKNIICLPGPFGSAITDFTKLFDSIDPNNLICWEPHGSTLDGTQFDSSKFGERWSSRIAVKNDAIECAKLMQSLGKVPFTAIGWSYGAKVALQMSTLPDTQIMWGCSSDCFPPSDRETFAANIEQQIMDTNKWSRKIKAPLEAIFGKFILEQLAIGYFDAVRSGNLDLCPVQLNQLYNLDQTLDSIVYVNFKNEPLSNFVKKLKTLDIFKGKEFASSCSKTWAPHENFSETLIECLY